MCRQNVVYWYLAITYLFIYVFICLVFCLFDINNMVTINYVSLCTLGGTLTTELHFTMPTEQTWPPNDIINISVMNLGHGFLSHFHQRSPFYHMDSHNTQTITYTLVFSSHNSFYSDCAHGYSLSTLTLSTEAMDILFLTTE